MPYELAVACAVLSAYLVGAVPFGLVIARLKGVDLRAVGSGNIGATNVGRALGFRWFLVVFALDAAKGTSGLVFLAPLAGVFSGEVAGWQPAGASAGIETACGLAAVVGHMFPVFARFRGGKGVATAAGVFAVMGIAQFAIALAVFALTLLLFRRMSVSSMGAAIALAIAHAVRDEAFGERLPVTALAILIAVLVVARHRANIRRIATGTEPRLGTQAETATAPDES